MNSTPSTNSGCSSGVLSSDGRLYAAVKTSLNDALREFGIGTG